MSAAEKQASRNSLGPNRSSYTTDVAPVPSLFRFVGGLGGDSNVDPVDGGKIDGGQRRFSCPLGSFGGMTSAGLLGCAETSRLRSHCASQAWHRGASLFSSKTTSGLTQEDLCQRVMARMMGGLEVVRSAKNGYSLMEGKVRGVSQPCSVWEEHGPPRRHRSRCCSMFLLSSLFRSCP